MTGLTLTHLTLSHFRSHRRLSLDFDGRPVAIYGPNGAGKTNILEAMSFLSPGRGLRRAAMAEVTRKPEGIGWRVLAQLTHDGQSHAIDTRSENGAARSVTLDGKTVPQLALGRILRVVWLIPAMDRLWIEGAEGRRRFLDRLTMSFTPDHGESALGYEKAMRDRNRLLKDGVQDPHWYRALEAQMARFGAAIHANRVDALLRLAQAQGAAETAFPIADLALRTPDEAPEPDWTEAMLLDAYAASRPRDVAAGRSLVGPHRTDLSGFFAAKGVPARNCSTGEQKALLISLILANARALSADFGSAPLILLDEVAAHLDRDRQAALYDEICALGAQAMMTGTGAELFAALGERAQRVEVVEGPDGSEVGQQP